MKTNKKMVEIKAPSTGLLQQQGSIVASKVVAKKG